MFILFNLHKEQWAVVPWEAKCLLNRQSIITDDDILLGPRENIQFGKLKAIVFVSWLAPVGV